MKIGVTSIGYECVEHMDKVLEPWLDLKYNDNDLDIVIGASHGVFPETNKLGYSVYSLDGTIQKLQQLNDKKDIDYIHISPVPIYEKDLRNSNVQFLLSQNIDLLWLLDLQDEIYTVQQIKEIVRYVESSDKDWFKINFKNYVFNDSTYIDDFVVPRIWKNNVNEGIMGFYYDNDIVYNNQKPANDLPFEIIPRDIGFIKHLSWVGSKEYLLRKIEFQKIHYGDCSYSWDDAKNCLSFNEEYYSKFNKDKPQLFKEN